MDFPEAMAVVQKHIRAAEAVAVLGAALGSSAGRLHPNDSLKAKIGTALEQVEPDFGDGLQREELEALYGFVRAALRQMLHLVELPDGGGNGWSFDDPDILETQGRSSRLVARLLNDHAARNPDFGALLAGGADFLDVGSGVGWISLSMAQDWPNLRAVGIDILEAALVLADRNLHRTGLAGRVTFHNRNVLDLDETGLFDVIFIPLIFIPETIVEDALGILYRALKPSGWLFTASYRVPEDSLQAALNDLKTTLSGGRAWTVEELDTLTSAAGLEGCGDIGTGSPIHLWAARRPA